ncbi:MAG: pullulanase-type alpha-1,6-glucosidase [Cyclonatronaceae bacterium]
MNLFSKITAGLMLLAGLLFLQNCDRMNEQATSEIRGAAAHWVASNQLLWDDEALDEAARYELRYSPEAAITVEKSQVSGGEIIPFTPSETTLDPAFADQNRHIADWPVFELEAGRETIAEALKGQLVALAFDENDAVITATRVQFPGVIDDLFAHDEPLGLQYEDDNIHLRVWAPTAQLLELRLYDADKNETAAVDAEDYDTQTGVWTFSGPAEAWDRAFYRLYIRAYHRENDALNEYEVTDPYSVSLSTDSQFSQFVDIANDPELKPEGWDALKKTLPAATDITLYEGHVRDFSVFDESVPENERGTFKAFTHNGEGGRALSNGMRHLKMLSEAGITHLHLLPVNDITTVIEARDMRVDLHQSYSQLCAALDQPEALQEYCERFGDTPIYEAFEELAAEDPANEAIQQPYHLPDNDADLADIDGFNWGYDPFHFNAVEGSYATDPDGVTRIREFREMVQALDEIGLKLVVDVVYNHTSAHGLTRTSVLDRVVPNYYQRYDARSGAIETSTCCPNTAAEYYMMERLIIDSVLFWAQQYKVDSFRFDLMGHHPKAVMQRLMEELSALTLEEHGVDGKNIYVYGEGWNFGEVADNRIFEQATQFNMNETGIGNFNDRSRDAIRGGNFTGSGRNQGFTNGQFLFPNEADENDAETRRTQLLDQADRIRVGMTGNLRSYPYINKNGDAVDGLHDYIGYAGRPQESVNYIDKHDNETLWDNTQAKLPFEMNTDDRVRVHMLSQAFITYGQGVPFYHMGTDILRSKSMDRNSYNSGDWFNEVDFTMQRHNWGRGLPPAQDNQERWEAQRGFLTNPAIDVQKGHLEQAHEIFKEQLRVRYSSPLFRLAEADDIHRRVAYHNVGPEQQAGIIAMTISDGNCAGADLDSAHDGILIMFNAHIEPQEFETSLRGLELHPVLAGGSDAGAASARITQTGKVSLPPLTAAVFVKPQQGNQGDFVCNEVEL